MAQPQCCSGEPFPPAVTRPATKSVGAEGIGSASQRNGLGGAASKRWLSHPAAEAGTNSPCATAGLIRYSQLRRLAWRGAVNAVPENCSAYRPYGQRCGELRPCGSAPGNASLAKWLPKPCRYFRGAGGAPLSAIAVLMAHSRYALP